MSHVTHCSPLAFFNVLSSLSSTNTEIFENHKIAFDKVQLIKLT